MSEYIASANAVLRSDMDLLLALDVTKLNPQGLARALTDGGGSAGSVELEHLLLAIDRRSHLIEIVRKAGRGNRNIRIADVPLAWFAGGLPACFRAELISGFQSNRFIIRPLKKRGAVGRPSAPFGSHVDDWLAIEKMVRRSRGRLNFEEAGEEYVDRERVRAGRGTVNLSRDYFTRERRMRRIRRAASDFIDWVRQIRS